MTTHSARTLFLVLATVSGLLNVAAVEGGKPNPGVLPPQAKFRGMGYGEWAATWWQTAFSIPIVDGDHPLFSGGPFEGEDGVVYLAAVVGEPTTVEFAIPAGTPLFFPVINSECSVIEPDPFHGDDEQELRECANGHIDNTSGLFAAIDGRPIENLQAFRSESPLFEFGPLPEDNVFGEPAGTASDSVDAGVYLLLAPLSVGSHLIEVGGTFDDFGVSIDTMFIVHVVP